LILFLPQKNSQIVDDDENNCDEAYAYVPDLGAYGVVVYSLADDKMWRVKHNFFHFDPLHGDYNVSGYNFQWTDGVFGMSLSNKLADG
jgi:Major royal jelly protein